MKEDRFLTGILIGIALLVVASLSVFFLRKDTDTYLPEDSPAAIVHNYIFALQNEDFERAYSYLATDENKPSYTTFLRDVGATNQNSVQVGEAEITGETASVQLIFTSSNGGLFLDRQYEYVETAFLIEENGDWKILDMQNAYWYWDWYEEKN